MQQVKLATLLAAGVAVSLSGCNSQDNTVRDGNAAEPSNVSSAHPADPIESAMAAAPASVSRNASIVQAQADGSMRTLRAGSNGWTCMPDNPTTPGPDPMCMDQNAAAWAQAWMTHSQPPREAPGFMYMLAGGTDASNTDPFAQAPTGGNNWIETGPHVMVVGSQSILRGYPSGPNPDTSAPYVMWAGTPYAHLMIPVR